ncbi:MAG: FISUMP domain-containing protein [Bacteroidales bacterium]|jgi:uncharacterized protein (TIGR02145 family)
MKRIYLFVLAVVMMATACEKVVTPEMSVDKTTAEVGFEGGMVTISLTANLPWTAACDNSAVTVSPTSGEASATVSVTVPETAVTSTQTIKVTFTMVGEEETITKSVVITQGAAPVISVDKSTSNISYEGGAVSIAVTANMAWTATCDNSAVTLAPASGDAAATVIATVPESTSDSEQTFTVSFVITADVNVKATTIITQESPGLKIGDDTYKIKKFGNRWWMVENLRYIPSGKSVSSDPTTESGIWYPFDVDEDVVMTSSEDVKKYGYLYDTATAMDISEITEANSGTFEGVQGICPSGWHIPTQAEAQALLDLVWDAETQKGAPTAALEQLGFNPVVGGYRFKSNSIATASYQTVMPGYFITSTMSSYSVKEETGAVTSQNKGMMKTNTATYKRFTIANTSNFGGNSVRCIKNAQ